MGGSAGPGLRTLALALSSQFGVVWSLKYDYKAVEGDWSLSMFLGLLLGGASKILLPIRPL